jgi:hypothetical protein
MTLDMLLGVALAISLWFNISQLTRWQKIRCCRGGFILNVGSTVIRRSSTRLSRHGIPPACLLLGGRG